jgi:hypothetical protein
MSANCSLCKGKGYTFRQFPRVVGQKPKKEPEVCICERGRELKAIEVDPIGWTETGVT